MKIKFALIASLAVLSGCASHYPERIVTKGPLICSANEVCPELAMLWNDETREGFRITAEINHADPYEIKQLTFLVDGQPYTYSTIQPTTHQDVAGLKNSSNFIRVPVSFLNSFRDAKEVDLVLLTDKGEIRRSILKANGEKSSAYLTFLKGYTEQAKQ